MKVYLEFSDIDGSHRIEFEGEKMSFGRGGDVDQRFDDDGLSRFHSAIYRDDERIWIADENSTNGTFVNGKRVGSSGMPLENGDVIKIGNFTRLTVICENPSLAASENEDTGLGESPHPISRANSSAANENRMSPLIPIAIIGFALIVMIGAGTVIAFVMLRDNSIASADDSPSFSDVTDSERAGNSLDNANSSSGNSLSLVESAPVALDNSAITNSPAGVENSDVNYSTGGKKYQQMSDEEKNQYVKVKAEKIARIIGNKSGESIPPAAIAQIRRFLDPYVTRIRSAAKDDCSMGGWMSSDLGSVLNRARKNARFIIRSFNQKGIDPQIGLYLAMIESEHCPCLQSGTGPLGLFQFTKSTGEAHGLQTRAGATPENPDQRCDQQAASTAAASYMKTLTGRIGTGPLSIPLAIASYNSGEGGLGKNLRTALEANENQERSFWTLVINSDRLAAQFQRENIKYVPKFYAAAIIGENPKDFGFDMMAISTYSN